jgi:hypothetical protein
MTDELSARLADLLDGTYDCVDRIVLNGYHSVCYSAGGFRLWWRSLMGDSEEQLDNAHVMRLAGRFSRRVRGFAKAHHIPAEISTCRQQLVEAGKATTVSIQLDYCVPGDS